MLITKTDPKGIDYYIQRLQTALHDRLAWGSNYHCHGRCYRNRKNDGFVAEVYQGDGEYKDVYFDDSLSAISFFGISGAIEKEGVMNTVDVHLVFFVDLSKLKPDIEH